ncbi:MAG: AAA family ATPase [Cyanobacteria bacterium P01_G01_bin.54]
MLNSLHISGFRTFKDLKVNRLGKVNLIVGRNNVGKTSLLEAVHLYTSPNVLEPILCLLERRQEYAFEKDENIVSLRSLFHQRDERLVNIKMGETDQMTWMTMSRKWRLIEGVGGERSHQTQRESDDQPEGLGSIEVLAIEYEDAGIKLSVPMYGEQLNEVRHTFKNQTMRSLFLPSNGFYDNSIEPSVLWDQVVLTDNEDTVLDALRVIEPNLERIVMVQGRRSQRLAMAKLSKRKPMPLRSLGDGMNRLFELAVGLVSTGKDGTFLVDEIDSGLHFRTLSDVWRLVFSAAKRLDIQVFATTHSWDCIEAFQKASTEHPEAGLLVRLERVDDAIYAETFSEEELAIITRQSIEVR